MKRLSQNHVQKRLSKRGFILLDQYKNAHTKVHLRCKYGHDFYAKFANINWGKNGCPVCLGKISYSLDEVKGIVKKHGGSVIGPYPNNFKSNTKITLSCKIGHRWSTSLGKLRQGRWCRECRMFKYSNHDLIRYIQQLAKKTGRIPVITDFIDGPDYSTIMKRLGGRSKALRMAGLVEKKVTKKEAIASLKKTAIHIGQVPSRQIHDYLKAWPSGSQIAKLFGGSWSKAIRAAGMRPRAGVGGRMWKVWESTCYEVAALLYGKNNVRRQMRFHDDGEHSIDFYIGRKRLGIDAKLSAYFHELHSSNQVERFVKSTKFRKIEFWCLAQGPFQDKRIKCVFPDELIARLRQSNSKNKNKLIKRIKAVAAATDRVRAESGLSTKKELVQDLLRFKNKKGRLPTQRELTSKNALMSGATYANLFGTYTHALMAAGANPPRTYWRQLTDKQLIAVFKKFIREVCKGRTPTTDDLHGLTDYPNLGVYTKRAGTYVKWLKLCGLESPSPNLHKIRNLSEKESLEILKEAYKTSGKPLVGKNSDFKKYVDWAPTMQWYAKTFGSWNNALRAAGIPLRRKQRAA